MKFELYKSVKLNTNLPRKELKEGTELIPVEYLDGDDILEPVYICETVDGSNKTYTILEKYLTNI